MSGLDPKTFYDSVMPEKFGGDYEHKRWHETKLKEVGYRQTRDAIVRHLFSRQENLGTILELGPGPGVWTKLLLERYPRAEITAVDISREMLERARHALSSGRVEFVESDIITFMNEKKYDLVFSSRMLEYVPDKRVFAQKVATFLAEEGRGALITKMPHYQRDKLLGRSVPEFHRGQITPDDLARQFREVGLRVEGVYPVTISVPLLQSAFMNRFMGKILCRFPMNPISAFFSESYLIVFTKP